MPSPEQIAAEVRRRPIGAVIVDICRNLAILPSHPLWRDIQNAVSQHGGSYVRLLKHVLIRNIQLAAELVASPEPSSLFLPPAPARPERSSSAASYGLEHPEDLIADLAQE